MLGQGEGLERQLQLIRREGPLDAYYDEGDHK